MKYYNLTSPYFFEYFVDLKVSPVVSRTASCIMAFFTNFFLSDWKNEYLHRSPGD